MIKGNNINQTLNGPLSLGDSLDQLEVKISKVGQGSVREAEDILHDLDMISDRFEELEPQGSSIKAEAAQFDYLTTSLKSHSRAFLKEIGGVNALKTLRLHYQPKKEHWWWFLDGIQSQKTNARIKRFAIGSGIVIVVLALIYFGYQHFLAPSPADQASMTYESSIEDLLVQGDLNGALDQVNKGLLIAPGDTTLLILKGVIQSKLGLANDAVSTFSQAEESVGSRETFLLDRALIYIRAGDPKPAIVDTQEIIKTNPQSAEAYFYEGTAYQALGDGNNAYTTFDTASKLAEAQGKTALVATIRLNMALLLQSGNLTGPTQTP